MTFRSRSYSRGARSLAASNRTLLNSSALTTDGEPSTRQPAAAATDFAIGPDAIGSRSDGGSFTGGALGVPVAGQIYKTEDGQVTVAVLPYGSGSVTVLGWDYEDQNFDGGWRSLLDRAVAKPSLSIGGATVPEGDSGAALIDATVTLSSPASELVQVDYATQDGSATALSDYISASGQLTFARGETSESFKVPVLGDTVVEADETISYVLAKPVAALIAGAGATTIANDDAPEPEAPQLPGPDPPDTTLPGVQVTALARALSRRAFLRRGVSGQLTPDEEAEFEIALTGRLTRGGRIARAGDVVIAETSLARSGETQTFRLKPKRRFRGSLARRMRLTLRIVATDAARNRRVVTRRIRVR